MDSGGRISPPLSSGPSAHETPAGHRRMSRYVGSQLALGTHLSLRLFSCSRSDQLTRDEAAARLYSKGGPSSGTLAKLVPPPSSDERLSGSSKRGATHLDGHRARS